MCFFRKACLFKFPMITVTVPLLLTAIKLQGSQGWLGRRVSARNQVSNCEERLLTVRCAHTEAVGRCGLAVLVGQLSDWSRLQIMHGGEAVFSASDHGKC